MRFTTTRLVASAGLGLVLLAGSAMAEPEATEPGVDEAAVFEILGEAVEHFDELRDLPQSSWIKRDRESARNDIDALIEEAIGVLDVPELVGMREDYRQLEEAIREERAAISELREKRVFAEDTDASTLTRLTPTDTLKHFTARTRGDYDLLIEGRQDNIAAYRQELARLRRSMSEALGELGLDMAPDQLELWLSSAIGDDVVSMGVVFRSISAVTERLEALTGESGEHLEYARRYYGMVVILHKLVVRMQETFLDRVDNEILPNLEAYRAEADEIIAESRRLIREGSHRTSLQNNIAANELTKRAIGLYTRVVSDQRAKVSEALRVSRREEDVAINTYRTVSLSASVAVLIRDGLDTFETLSNLQVPEVAEFQNAEIREEFRKLTARLEGEA